MEIEKLLALPEMERNEDDDGFAYPIKFQNKLYLYQDQYIFIKKSVFDALPKTLIEVIIKNLIPKTSEESITKEDVIKICDDQIASAFGNINRVMDNWTSKIESKIDLENLQTFRDQIEKQLNDALSELENRLEEISSTPTSTLEEMKFDNGIIEEIKEKIKEESSITDKNIEDLHFKIDSITKEVYEKMTSIIQEEVDKKNINPNQTPNKVSLGSLVALKESGYSVEDIIKLKDEGLV
jgi:hypothetical protein